MRVRTLTTQAAGVKMPASCAYVHQAAVQSVCAAPSNNITSFLLGCAGNGINLAPRVTAVATREENTVERDREQ